MTHTLPPRAPDLWDKVIRVTHWSLASVIVANALITQGGSSTHLWLGWAGMALLGVRLVWGLVGPLPARFAAFPPRPFAALRHMVQLWRAAPDHYPSHNPAGAMMAYTLWASLAVVIGTGLVMKPVTPWVAANEEQILLSGDWSALAKGSETADEGGDDDGAKGGLRLRDVHEFFANAMLFLAVLHIAGVIIEGRAMRRNLVAPMLLGPSKPRG